jgi:hypothetical protein
MVRLSGAEHDGQHEAVNEAELVAMGDGVRMTSPAPRPRRSAQGAKLESMVLEVSSTPFGSPVVPDV